MLVQVDEKRVHVSKDHVSIYQHQRQPRQLPVVVGDCLLTSRALLLLFQLIKQRSSESVHSPDEESDSEPSAATLRVRGRRQALVDSKVRLQVLILCVVLSSRTSSTRITVVTRIF